MIFGVFMMSMMQIFNKMVSKFTTISILKVVMARSIVLIIGATGHSVLVARNNPFKQSRRNCYFLFHRGFWGTFVYTLEVTSVFLMPVSTAIVLISMQPIFTNILGHFMLGEKMRLLDVMAIFASTLGVILIASPEWFLKIFSGQL
jgi:drug/metabolite transporter (DMT)-like permease